MLGYKGREYHGGGFSVRVDSKTREGVAVVYKRGSVTVEMMGERIGPQWRSLAVRIPMSVDPVQAKQIANDLASGLPAMGYFGYEIDKVLGTEAFTEEEQRTAREELEAMGFSVTVAQEKGTVNLGFPPKEARSGAETMRKRAARIMQLTQIVQGVRKRIEVIAKSDEV